MAKTVTHKPLLLLVALLALSFLFFSQPMACHTATVARHDPFCSAQQIIPAAQGHTAQLPETLIPTAVVLFAIIISLFSKKPRAPRSLESRIRLRQHWLEPALRRLNGIPSGIFLPILFATRDF